MKVKDLLDSEEKWCQKASAKNSRGGFVSPESTQAVRWCLIGAVYRCYGFGREQINALSRLHAVINKQPITRFNDTHTFRQVRAAIVKADI